MELSNHQRRIVCAALKTAAAEWRKLEQRTRRTMNKVNGWPEAAPIANELANAARDAEALALKIGAESNPPIANT